MTWVKICGVTCAADARACVDAGADAVGFNFWPRSKRYQPRDVLAEVSSAVAGRIERIGVFVNATLAELEAALTQDLIDTVQLHGDELPEQVAALGEQAIKALRLSDVASLEAIDRYPGSRLLIDAPVVGYGGAGQRLDAALASAAVARAAPRRILLAGGLTPDNVAQVNAHVRAFGVDVASGVERGPGIKDHELVRRFVAAAKGAP